MVATLNLLTELKVKIDESCVKANIARLNKRARGALRVNDKAHSLLRPNRCGWLKIDRHGVGWDGGALKRITGSSTCIGATLSCGTMLTAGALLIILSALNVQGSVSVFCFFFFGSKCASVDFHWDEMTIEGRSLLIFSLSCGFVISVGPHL